MPGLNLRTGQPPFKDDPRCGCRHVPVSWFYPSSVDCEPGEQRTQAIKQQNARTRTATDHCRVCVFRTECLEFALENNENHGIWGGESERSRKLIKKGRAEALADNGPEDNNSQLLGA